MNYNNSGARRGKPKRMLDPSVGVSPPVPSMPQSPYTYNQQIPVSGAPQPEYGFNVPPHAPPAYGFEQSLAHQQMYPGNEVRQESYGSPEFATRLLAEPIVTNMAVQYGSALVGTGKQHLERYVPITALKYYFAVDTDYVVSKLALLFFPFTQKDWSIKYEQDAPLQPRYERNAPDMYIPTMAYLTYIVVAGLALGTQERFSPEQLGILASSALAWGIIELLVHTITLYRFGYYFVLVYFSVSLAFFLVRSLKLRVIPEGHTSYTASGNKRRLYFILFVAALQPFLMWWLSSHLVASAEV